MKLLIYIIAGIVFTGFLYYFVAGKSVFNFGFKQSSQEASSTVIEPAIRAKFRYLSKNGNSSCSPSFRDSISAMQDNARLQGSCCSAMSLHRYSEQVEGLKNYKDVPEIPSGPYDIEARLAKKLMAYYDNIQLTPDQQREYDYAMQNSDEKGPCCCKCWRWNVYGGLGKYLISQKGYTGKQITEIWNLSDGCGGEGDHVRHAT